MKIALSAFSRSRLSHIWLTLKSFWRSCFSKTEDYYHDEIEACKAPEPSDIHWEHLSYAKS